MDDSRIKANIAAREAASAAFDILESECTADDRFDVACAQFVLLVRKRFPGLIPAVEIVRDKPMSDAEAKSFEGERLAFGKYKDQVIQDVPIDYLVWLEEQDDFRRELNRYLRSERGQRRQDERPAPNR